MTRKQQQQLCVGRLGPETRERERERSVLHPLPSRDLQRTFVLVIDEGAKTVLMSTAANFDTNFGRALNS